MQLINRRRFLQQSCAVSAASLVVPMASAHEQPVIGGKADSCIFIWLGGGASHVDTFDPKAMGDVKAGKAGSYYAAIPTALEGIQLCEPMPRLARLLDRTVLVRSAHHDVIDEHAAAVNRLHTGRPTTGTTIYPSIGSVVSHELGARGEGVPPYVVMGYPSASRGAGFLGAKYGYIYLTETDLGPAGLKRPPGVSDRRQARRDELLDRLRRGFAERNAGERIIQDYADTSVEGMQLAGPNFMSVFDLQSESAALREDYGGEFGQRCLLARRLVQAGVRFVEVSFNLNFINGTGWDTHNEGQLNQHILIHELDRALGALVIDLERHQRLDRTLIVVATEFGRPPEFDGGGGRGHYSKAFSMLLAGGGLRCGQVVGVTGPLGKEILEQPVSIPDFHATIYASLGIDYQKELYDDVRPVPLTDHGQPIAQLF
jgi:hypothetical protein